MNANIGLKTSWILSTKTFNWWNWVNQSSNAADNEGINVSSLVLLSNSSASNEATRTKAQKIVRTAMTDDWSQFPVIDAIKFVDKGDIANLAEYAFLLQMSVKPRLNNLLKL